MREILEPIRQAIPKMRHVGIEESAIDGFIDSIEPSELKATDFDEPVVANLSQSERAALTVVYNAVNFYYWGQPKWALDIDGEEQDGGNALLLAMRRAIDNGYDLLNAEYLQGLSHDDFADITQGNVEIPLLSERVRLLRELGGATLAKYHGSFQSIIESSGYRADRIVRKLTADFPAVFDDRCQYKGKEVCFYKRAQLVPSNLADMYASGYYSHEIKNLGSLTAFADYKVPQVLRKLGILKYADGLAAKLDRLEEIPAGSEEEVEIRMATVWAVDLAAQKVQKRFPGLTSAKIDNLLWFRGQVKSPDDQPYHRTRTIWY